MKTFKEFYIKYIKESPENTGPLGIENKTDDEMGIINIVDSNHFKKVYAFKDLNISLFENRDGNDVMVHFVDDSSNKSIGYVNYEELPNNGIKISSVLNRSEQRGLAYRVYTDFLLGGYDFIISDGKHSPDAKKFWEKLVSSLLGIKKIYSCNIIDDKIINLNPIKDISELNNFYGGGEYEKHLFLISNYDI